MRFIGNKEKLVDNIYSVVLDAGVQNGIFCDFFSGTSNVGRYFKDKGYSIISSDLLYFSYVLQKAYIENNTEVEFIKLFKLVPDINQSGTLFFSPLYATLNYLNNLEGVEGFIYRNYTEDGTRNDTYVRKYFTGENGKIIDAQRQKIQEWKNLSLITESEYFVLLACLVETVPFYSNISGVYGAFLKNYDPRALKKLEIKPIRLYKSKKKHHVYNEDSMKLIGNLDVTILYLDPPYNERQYAPNYHVLETIAKYDEPKIKGVTGMRDYSEQKSNFCNAENALKSLEEIAQKAKYKYLLLSYNSEGIMSQKDILKILGKFGDVQLKEVDYRRFRSNSKGGSATNKDIKEQIYVLKRK